MMKKLVVNLSTKKTELEPLSTSEQEHAQREIAVIEELPQVSSLEEQLKEKNQEIQLLKVQNQALADRVEFHEDLIAEMAMIIYE